MTRIRISLLALAVTVPVPAAVPQDFVDDTGIKRSLQQSLENSLDDVAVPSGATLVKQLRLEKPTETGLTLPARKAGGESAPSGSLYERLRDATVVIGNIYKCDKCDKWHTGTAGGVLIAPDGLVLTNYHVIDAANPRVFGALTSDGDFFPVVKVVHASRRDDLALVRLGNAADLPYATIAGSAQVGDDVFSVSHPDSHYFTFGSGKITRFYLSPQGKTPLGQVNLNFAKGSSGAGVFNRSKELSGLIVSTRSIYYEKTRTEQKNLQMVIRSIIPLPSIQALLADVTGPDAEDTATGE